jgi:hypothetical protein
MMSVLSKLVWVYFGANVFVFALSMFVSVTGWWPSTWQVPWSDVGSFVETKDGIVLVDIGMWRRIELYDRSGEFLKSWRPPYSKQFSMLATDESGAIYLLGADTVFKFDAHGKVQKKYISGSYLPENWELSELTGEPRFAPERSQGFERKIVKKDQILFSEHGSGYFLCPDGTQLVPQIDSLIRVAPSGEKLVTYHAPRYCWPSEFPVPAAFACIVGTILFYFKVKKEKHTVT